MVNNDEINNAPLGTGDNIDPANQKNKEEREQQNKEVDGAITRDSSESNK